MGKRSFLAQISTCYLLPDYMLYRFYKQWRPGWRSWLQMVGEWREHIDHGRNGLIVPGRYGTCSWMDSNGILERILQARFLCGSRRYESVW